MIITAKQGSHHLRRGYCYRLCPSIRYAISSQTAGQNPTKFGEWLAYTSGACKSMFIFGPAPRGPGEGSKGQILTSMGICDGVPSTAQSSCFWRKCYLIIFHYVYWSFLLPWQLKQEADHHNFSYFELPLPKQHLYQIRVILLQWIWRSCLNKRAMMAL